VDGILEKEGLLDGGVLASEKLSKAGMSAMVWQQKVDGRRE